MKKINRIILVETGDFVPRRALRKYKEIYADSSKFQEAKKLPNDFLGLIDYGIADHKAGLIIDWVYAQYIKDAESGTLNEIMQDERAHLFIKKIILISLARLCLSFMLAEKFVEKYSIQEPIDFIPAVFPYTIYQVVAKRTDLFPKNVFIPQWYVDRMKYREIVKNTIYRIAFILYPIAISLLMKIGASRTKVKRNYHYGVHIWNTSFIFSFPSCSCRMDFLEAKDGVNPANTLYIMDSRISKENLQNLKTNGYDYCYFEEMVRTYSAKRYFKKIYPCIFQISKRMFSSSNNKILLTEAYLKSLRWYILWEIFYSYYNVNIFIAVQEPGNIPRVLIQKRHRANNIFVFMSTSYDLFYREDMFSSMDAYYNSLIYDRMVSSKVSIEDYFKKNRNLIYEYVESGIIWSDIIFNLKCDSILKKNIRKELKIPEDKIIIGFFDTDIGRFGVCDNSEGCQMFDDIYRLLESNQNYYLIYKTRTEDSISKDTELKKHAERLIGHNRVFYANKSTVKYTTHILIGICDLVIGVFASSVPLESVAGGVPAVYYIPAERFDNDTFLVNTFPHFCALGYDRLKEYTEYWLYQCNAADFSNFQDTYIKRYIDSYCDGRAAERLRRLLRQYDMPMHEGVGIKELEAV